MLLTLKTHYNASNNSTTGSSRYRVGRRKFQGDGAAPPSEAELNRTRGIFYDFRRCEPTIIDIFTALSSITSTPSASTITTLT